MWRYGLAAALIVFVVPPVWALFYSTLGPKVDNLLGVLTKRDLSLFLDHAIGNRSLGELIEERAGLCRWSALHDEVVWATNVECVTENGRPSWELNHRRPRRWLPKQPVYVTPLNQAAAMLVPELLPHGLRPERIAPWGYRSGVVYDLALPVGADPHGLSARLGSLRDDR
jgi:hypothetical protein